MNFSWFQDIKKAGKLTLLLFLTALVLASVSCVTNRQAVYVQPEKPLKEKFVTIAQKPRIIQPGDELYITINSEDQTSNIFRVQSYNMIANNDITLITYLVNEEGYIRMPPLGNLQIKGLTLDEAANVIEKALVGIIASPAVIVKFVNKTVTVLGYVNNPGRYDFLDQKINIFQALGYAGDISTYGNRKKIMLLREENNVITRRYIDLTNEKLLGSEEYYIKPNDVIYVEPLKRRHWDMNTFPFSLLLGVTSTVILVLSYLSLYR